jgi:hypothetical protein
MKITKKQYQQYLNEIGESLSDEEFIIGGKFRKRNCNTKYGNALRKYDPIAFEV